MDSTYWKSGVSRRRFLGATAAAGAGLASAALIGCSSSAPTTPAAGGSAAPAAGAPKGPTLESIVGKNYAMRDPQAVPVYGGTLNYASGTPTIANLDPFSTTSSMGHQVASQVYSHLMHNSRPGNNRNEFTIYPDVATSWEIKDPLKMTFKLRDGMKMQNIAPLNGRPLTSEDVKYSIERAATDKSSPFRGTLGTLKSVETPDPQTVVINVTKFDAGFFPALADRFVWIIPKEHVESGNLKTAMAGSGPFIFQKWEQDTRVHFKKNPDYYIKGVPFVDELNFMQIGENQTRVAALRSGQAHIAGVDRPDEPSFVGKKEFTTETWLAVGTWSLMMNYKDARFKDDRVRQALSLAFDPEVALKIQGDEKGVWRGILSAQNGKWALSQAELKDPKYFLKQDLTKGKQLMTAAGFPDGFSAKYLYRTGMKDQEDFVQYQVEVAKKAGIANLTLVGLDSPTMRKMQDEVSYDGLCAGIDGEPTPEAFLLDFRTGGPKNGMGLSDKELDAKIDKVNGTPDTEERLQATLNLVREMLQKVYWKRNFTDNTAQDQWLSTVKNYLGPVPQQYNNTGMMYTWIDKA